MLIALNFVTLKKFIRMLLICLQDAVRHSSCEKVYLTRIYKEYPADTYFPEFESDYETIRYDLYAFVYCSYQQC